MNDLRQAAQQALERLEACVCPPSVHHDIINPLRTALEQQQAEPVLLNGLTEAETNATASVTGLTKQAEPVAPKCAAIIEVFDKDWRMEYLSLPVGKHKLYVQQYTYTAQPQRKPLTDEQADQIISGLQTCHHQSSKREFLKVWLRDWAAHGIKEGT